MYRQTITCMQVVFAFAYLAYILRYVLLSLCFVLPVLFWQCVPFCVPCAFTSCLFTVYIYILFSTNLKSVHTGIPDNHQALEICVFSNQFELSLKLAVCHWVHLFPMNMWQRKLHVIALVPSKLLWLPVFCMEDANLSADRQRDTET